MHLEVHDGNILLAHVLHTLILGAWALMPLVLDCAMHNRFTQASAREIITSLILPSLLYLVLGMRRFISLGRWFCLAFTGEFPTSVASFSFSYFPARLNNLAWLYRCRWRELEGGRVQRYPRFSVDRESSVFLGRS